MNAVCAKHTYEPARISHRVVGGKASPQASHRESVATQGMRSSFFGLPLMFYPAATIPTNFAASFDSSGLKMRPHWCPSRLRLCHHFVDASVGSADTTGLELTLKGQHVALQRRERLQGSISWVHPITCSPIRASYLPIPKKDCRIKCWAHTKMQGRCDIITAEVRQEGGKMKRAGNDAYLG